MTPRPLTGYRAGMMAERARQVARRRDVSVVTGEACFDPRASLETIRFPKMSAEKLLRSLERDTSTIITLQRGAPE